MKLDEAFDRSAAQIDATSTAVAKIKESSNEPHQIVLKTGKMVQNLKEKQQ